MRLEIQRKIRGQVCAIRLTDEEMEKAYRMRHYAYLKEDFLNALEDPTEGQDFPITYEQLEQYPAIQSWLCEHYDYFFDANMSHNDLIELVFHKLKVTLRDFGAAGISGFANSLICKEVS